MTKMVKMLNNRKGFTIIELIVVVVIIGILVAFGIPRILNMTARARYNTYLSNKKIVTDALERYYVEHTDAYPAQALVANDITGDPCALGANNGWARLVDGGYLKEIPNDPYTANAAGDYGDIADWAYTSTGTAYTFDSATAHAVPAGYTN